MTTTKFAPSKQSTAMYNMYVYVEYAHSFFSFHSTAVSFFLSLWVSKLSHGYQERISFVDPSESFVDLLPLISSSA